DEDENNYLVAYYSGDVVLAELKQWLRDRLPGYMQPSLYIHLDHFEYTSSGKIDRQRLPKTGAGSGQTEYVAPRTSLEEQLSAIWCEVLGKEKVSVTDNFFEIGGNSLRVISVLVAVNNLHENALKAGDLYNYGTIEEIAGFLNTQLSGESAEKEHFEEFEL
ncbi:MAG: hypothetical protein JWO44_2627, partial [Bacteroidetes bacterium]|nr:hypothetical protein [Bacteroidota bacterium]